ncbi:MAG: glycosyltransferase family 2 protein [Verrucomicrobia bacterium]|nr:glycosyltransferase family 2 protein [Verrucomicrobiota bacterium]
MNKNQANISVIIPAFNRAGLIGETLWSLLNQTVPAKEIIVVDDGSTDGTAEKALEAFENWKLETGNLKKDGREQFSAKSNIQHPILKILHQANAGPGAARNRGLAEATGEFIHFFDSDDIVAPNKHEVQLRALLDSGADIAYGPWVKGRIAPKEAQTVAGDEFHAEARRRGDFKLTTEDTESTEVTAGQGLDKPNCAAFSNPLPIELTRDCANTSPNRSADGPAVAESKTGIGSAKVNQLADSKGFLEDPTQAGLQVESQKIYSSRSANDPGASAIISESVLIRAIRGSKFPVSYFSAEGPVLQARGLPKGDLIKALLTNWSIVPHACLFRRSILEKAGGFPEDIWVGEDQLLFLRCLLAGARVVHTPGTMVYYRVGNDPGKLTATGAAQKRHARDWARFLLKANKEVTSGEWRVTRVEEKNSTTIERRVEEKNSTTIERQGGREKEQPKVGPKGEGVGTTESNHTNLHENGEKVSTTDNTDGHGCQKSQPGDAQGTCAGASESDSLTSKLFDSPVSESLTRSASDPASLPAISYSLPFTRRPSAWFGFRLRAYEAWRDLEKFFPNGEDQSKNDLQGIWKRNWFSGLRFEVSGFVLRKWGGLMNQIFGHRVKGCFRPGKFTSREKALFDAQ